MNKKPIHVALIMAAGHSLRMQGIDKIETEVLGKPLIAHTLAPLLASTGIQKIVIACNADNKKIIQKIFPKKQFPNIHLSLGGATRFQSAKKAFQYAEKHFALTDKSTLLFHNSGNVLASQEEIEETIRVAQKTGACIVAHRATDTLKRINKKNDTIIETIDRSQVLHAETPQTFRYDVLKKAYRHAQKNGEEATDEALLVERLGHPVSWIPASIFNRKITTQHDLVSIKSFLEAKIKAPEKQIFETVYGLGTDMHFFDTDTKNPLILCGIRLPKFPKLKGKSDADVALHALATAISQTVGGGSLGTFADPMCRQGITDSEKYLEHILAVAAKKEVRVTHVGLHFECGKPAIDPLAPVFKKSLARLLSLDKNHIGITATTGEKSTPWARGEGIFCTAIVTVARQTPQ